MDHLGGILAHLSGSPVAKFAGRGILDPEFFPMLQISQKSTKTKPLCAPRCQKKKAGGRRSSPTGESIRRPTPVGRGTACQTPPQRSPRHMQSKCRQYICPQIFGWSLFSPPYIPPGAPRIPSGSSKNCILPGLFSLQVSIFFFDLDF